MSDESTSNRDRILHVRVSEAERLLLEQAAGDTPLTTWVRVLALNAARGGTGHAVRAFGPNRWIPFLELFPGGVESLGTEIADRAVADAACRRGAYMVARFHNPPMSAPDVLDPALVYIGETHGRTATLRSRLRQFGRSAGFFSGGRRDGHYAAWNFTDGVDSRPVPLAEVYVALLPVPAGIERRGDLHGIWPLYAEAALLMERALASTSGRLPPLNSSGSQGPDAADVGASFVSEWVLQRSEDDVAALFQATGRAQTVVAQRLLQTLARGVWGYRVPRVQVTEDSTGTYAGCHLGAGRWLYLGWTKQGKAFVSVWLGETCEFGAEPGEEPAADAAGFEALVRTLLTTYI